jgi:hypothetical protein
MLKKNNIGFWIQARQDKFSLNNFLSYIAYQSITQSSQMFWVGTKGTHSEKN